MKKFLKLFATLLVVVMVLSAFAACGKNEKPVDDNPVDDNPTPAHEHVWDEGKVTKEATCTEEGEKTFKCTGCDETKTEKIAALGHTWGEAAVTKEATCKEEGEKKLTCSVCGETKTEAIEKLAHTWDAGTVTKAATTDAEGEKTFKCAVCGETKTETIAKIKEDSGESSGAVTPGAIEGTVVQDNATYALNDTGDAYRLCYLAEEDEDHNDITPFVIPGAVRGIKVTEIQNDAFKNLTKLRNVTIGANVKEIGESAFEGSGIVEITIPNTVETIGEKAFKDCHFLQQVTIGYGVEEIPENAFAGCDQIAILSIGAGSTGEDSQIKLTNTHFKDANNSLVKVTLGENVAKVKADSGDTAYAFSDTTKLVVLEAEKSLFGVAGNRLYDLAKATEDNEDKIEFFITKDDPETDLDESGYVFFTDTTYKSYLMAYVGGGQKLDPEDEDEEIDPAAKVLTLLVSYEDDDHEIGEYEIYKYAFYGRDDIKTVKMAELDSGEAYKLTRIGDSAFEGCTYFDGVKTYGLAEIEIPVSVTYVGISAFESCDQLTAINYKGTKAQFALVSLGGNWNLNTPTTMVIKCTNGNICGAYGAHDFSVPVVLPTMTYTAETAATCTANGMTAHWHCSTCDTYFDGAGATDKTADSDFVIPAGHTDADNDNVCDVCTADLST